MTTDAEREAAIAQVAGIVADGRQAGDALREQCQADAATLRNFAAVVERSAADATDDGSRFVLDSVVQFARKMATQLDTSIVPLSAMAQHAARRETT